MEVLCPLDWISFLELLFGLGVVGFSSFSCMSRVGFSPVSTLLVVLLHFNSEVLLVLRTRYQDLGEAFKTKQRSWRAHPTSLRLRACKYKKASSVKSTKRTNFHSQLPFPENFCLPTSRVREQGVDFN